MSEKPLNDGKNLVIRNEKGQVMAGSVLNPAGKPIGVKHLSTTLNEMILEVVKDSPNKSTYKELLLKRIIKDAIEKGNPHFVQLIFDRLEGKPDQGINMKVEGEVSPTSVNVMEIAKRVSEELKNKKTK